jgi:hypothetical protein
MKEKHYLVIGYWCFNNEMEMEVYGLSHNEKDAQKIFDEQVLIDKENIGSMNYFGANWEIVTEENQWFEAKNKANSDKLILQIEII